MHICMLFQQISPLVLVHCVCVYVYVCVYQSMRSTEAIAPPSILSESHTQIRLHLATPSLSRKDSDKHTERERERMNETGQEEDGGG